MSKKRILITGANGFAGGHLVDYLISKNDIELFAASFEQSEDLEKKISPDHIFIGDLTDYKFTVNSIKESNPATIFHLAAMSIVQDSINNAQKILSINTQLQLNLMEAIRTEAPKTRIIAVCSANEYGLVDKANIPINENTPLKPLNPYAVSKITQEYIALQYHFAHKLDVVILRPFNHTGDRQLESFVIPALAKQIAIIEQAKDETTLKVGNLNAIRDFTDVKDMVRAYYLASIKCKSGEIYNIGSGRGVSIQEALDILLSLSKKKILVEQDPKKMRPSDVPILIADSSKFRDVTGWKPTIKLEETLKRVLNYWQDQISKEKK